MKETKNTKVSKILGELVGMGLCWLISAGFIMWGWNTLAPHLNCPQFTYWEIFAMRMALSYIAKILWQKENKG